VCAVPVRIKRKEGPGAVKGCVRERSEQKGEGANTSNRSGQGGFTGVGCRWTGEEDGTKFF